MRVMALDVGERRIGVALSDPEGIMATQTMVLECRGPEADYETLRELVERWEVGQVVLGLPRSLDGQVRAQAQGVLAFGEALAQRLARPVTYWDERLSTVAAHNLLAARGIRARERRRQVDAVAAALILQAYLDHQSQGSPRDSSP